MLYFLGWLVVQLKPVDIIMEAYLNFLTDRDFHFNWLIYSLIETACIVASTNKLRMLCAINLDSVIFVIWW